MTDDIERLRATQRFIFKMLQGENDGLRKALRETGNRLVALAGVLVVKGLVTEEEWTEATAEIEAARAVEDLFDPRIKALEDVYNRLLAGEEIPDDELNRLIAEAQKPPEEEAR